MTALQVMLLIIGLVFFVGSFFFTEKLSSSDINELKKIGEKEIKTMLDVSLKDAEARLASKIDEQTVIASAEFERGTDKETNEKILSISEYADTVLNSMNETHNQIMFLYERLNDKQEMATRMTGELQALESNILALKEHVAEEAERYEVTLSKVEEAESEAKRKEKAEAEMQDLKEAFMAKVSEENAASAAEKPDTKAQIVSMYKEGYSEVEIAKRLGVGLGEIKLILGLFDEEYRA